MISPLWLISGIFAIIAVVAGLSYAFDVEFNPTQIVVVSILFVVVIIFAFGMKMFRGRGGGGLFSDSATKEMEKAEAMARKYSKEVKGEELDDREAHGIRRPYGDGGTAWGFKFNRGLNAKNPGAPLVIIIGKDKGRGNMEILRWNNHPGSEEQEDPFFIFSAGYTGAPFPGMSPDSDASFHSSRYGSRPGQTFNIGPAKDNSMQEFFSGKKRND